MSYEPSSPHSRLKTWCVVRGAGVLRLDAFASNSQEHLADMYEQVAVFSSGEQSEDAHRLSCDFFTSKVKIFYL